MADCDLCGRSQSDAAYACARCASRCRGALLQLAELAPELDVTIARLSRVSSGGATVDDPLPVNIGAAADAWAVVNVISAWSRHASSRRGIPIQAIPERDHHALAAAAVVLAGQLGWLRHQPEGAEALDELADACALAIRIVDRKSPRWYAGPCGAQEGQDDPCSVDLYASPAAATIRCPACGATHDANQRRGELLTAACDQLVWADLAARALGALGLPCTRSQIADWARRGRLTTRGHDSASRVLYRVGDVIELARKSPTKEAT